MLLFFQLGAGTGSWGMKVIGTKSLPRCALFMLKNDKWGVKGERVGE